MSCSVCSAAADALEHVAPLSFYGDLATEARRTLDRVGLLHLAEHPVSDIAYGEKPPRRAGDGAGAEAARSAIGRAAGGPFEHRTIDGKVADRLDPRQTAVIMIEHDMDTALDLAETVTLLNYGKVIVDGERDTVIADPRTREVYLGT